MLPTAQQWWGITNSGKLFAVVYEWQAQKSTTKARSNNKTISNAFSFAVHNPAQTFVQCALWHYVVVTEYNNPEGLFAMRT